MKKRLIPCLLVALLTGAGVHALADGLPRLGCIYYGVVRNCYGGHCTADDNVRLTVYRKGTALTWCNAGTVNLPSVDYQIQISTVAPGQTPDVGTAVEGETNSVMATVGGVRQGLIGNTNLVVSGRGTCIQRDFILGTDSNGNGLPDEWEAFVLDGFMAMGNYDITAVGTNDVFNGVKIIDHFLGGTFPFLPDDALRIENIRLADNGVFEITFLANAGFQYGVNTTTNSLSGGWTLTRIGSTAATAGQSTGVLGEGAYMKAYVPTNGVKAFYKLFVQ